MHTKHKTSLYNRLQMIDGVSLQTSTLETSCKITVNERFPLIGDEVPVSYSFGTGMKKFCMTASNRKPREIYIDRVERNNLCVKSGLIDDEGTSKIALLGMYFMKTRSPLLKRFTFQDDSYLYCVKGTTSGKKLSMTYEAILKYNQTWYQQKCHARLSGFVSKKEKAFEASPQNRVMPSIVGQKVGKTIEYRTIYYEVVPDSMMARYLESLIVLDQPSMAYERVTDPFPMIERYREDYIATSTPREFVARIRNRLSQEDYCMQMNGWMESYLKFLDVKAYKDDWFILVEDIVKPDGYVETPMKKNAVERAFYGGATQKRSISKRSTSKRTKKTWKMGPCMGGRSGYAVGDFGDI